MEWTHRRSARPGIAPAQPPLSVQHESDHLAAKLYVDDLSQLKRQRIRKRIEKSRKSQPQPSDSRLGTPAI